MALTKGERGCEDVEPRRIPYLPSQIRGNGIVRSNLRGTWCVVRVWGCNGQVIEEGLNLDGAARRQLHQGVEALGFDPGGADGVFGPRDARGDSSMAIVSGRAGDGVSGRRGVGRPLRSASGSGTAAAAAPSGAVPAEQQALAATASPSAPTELEGLVLAVGDGQHEPGGGASRRDRIARRGLRRHAGGGRRRGGWRRRPCRAGRGVPGLRGVSGDGGDAGQPSGAGALRGDGVRVSGIARRRAVRLSGLELLAKITMRSIHACHRGSSREWEPRRGRRCQATLKTDPLATPKTDPRRNGVC